MNILTRYNDHNLESFLEFISKLKSEHYNQISGVVLYFRDYESILSFLRFLYKDTKVIIPLKNTNPNEEQLKDIAVKLYEKSLNSFYIGKNGRLHFYCPKTDKIKGHMVIVATTSCFSFIKDSYEQKDIIARIGYMLMQCEEEM